MKTYGKGRELYRGVLDSTLYMNSFESDKNTKDNNHASSVSGMNNPSFIKTILEPKTLFNELASP